MTAGPQESPQDTAAWHAIADVHGAALVRLAAASILHGLAHGTPLSPDPDDFDAALAISGASFVTLTKGGDLRGCIGSVMAWRGLLDDVADNAFKAAFGDPRFENLNKTELDQDLDLSISLLTPPAPLPVDDEVDALNKIRPNIDGLIMEDKGRRGLFLPQVWEQLPEAEAFLTHLKRKAGLPLDWWSPSLKLSRFESVSVKSSALPEGESLWRGMAV